MEEERNAKNDTSMMARLSAKIINNLQVRVNHIHIRFEDHSSCPGHPFAAGVILEELRLYSPSEGDAPLIPGVMHKKAHITRFGVYWDFDEPACIRAEDVESFQQDMDVAFTSASVASIAIPTNATSAPTTTTPTNATSAATTTTPPHKSNEKQGVRPQHWIVEPISLSFSMDADTRSVELRKPEVKAVVEQVAAEQGWSDQVEETRRMMHAYKHVRKDGVRGRTAAEEWELMSAYLFAKYPGVFLEPSIAVAKDFCYRCWDRSNRAAPVLVVTGEMDRFCVALEQEQYRDLLRFVAALNTQTLRAKYKRFRPREEAVEAAPRAWWRFAIQSVCWENGRQRENKGWKAFMAFKQQRLEYIELYQRKKQGLLKKDPEGLAQLAQLEEKLSLENIVLFRKVAKKEMEMAEKEKKKKKKKEKKGLLSRFFKKEEEDEEEEEVLDTHTREELLTEFEIDESECSPWEGGRPEDVLFSLQFTLGKMGISLRSGGSSILETRLTHFATSVVKRKERLEVLAGLRELCVEDESEEVGQWTQVVYPEKSAVFDKKKLKVFLPPALVEGEDTPFLQAALTFNSSPKAKEDADVTVKVTTLPLCVVGNVACVMDTLQFIVPELSRLDLRALSASASSLYSELSATKKLKLKAKREAVAHKYVEYDVWLGALHVLLPEDKNKSVTETQSIVVRLGDLSVSSHPRRVSMEETLDAKSIYDEVQVSMSRVNVLLTNGEKEWMKARVQEEKNLYIVDDFNMNLTLGLSVAPSEMEFANTRVEANVEMMKVRLTKQKMRAVLRFLSAFAQNVHAIVEDNSVDFSVLKSEAIQFASSSITVPKKGIEDEKSEEKEEKKEAETEKEKKDAETEKEEKDEMEEEKKKEGEVKKEKKGEVKKDEKDAETEKEKKTMDAITLLQQKRILSLTTHVEGVSVLMEEVSSANEHTAIIDATVAGLELRVEHRSFDTEVAVTLRRIEVKDCLQSLSKRRERFLVVSKKVGANGEVEAQEAQDLFKVTVGVVQPFSPSYAASESDVTVRVAFGSLSVLPYRPTLYHLMLFFAPEPEPQQQTKRARRASTASVTSYLSDVLESESGLLKTRAADLIAHESNKVARYEKHRPLPVDWLRNKVKLVVEMQSLNVLLVTVGTLCRSDS